MKRTNHINLGGQAFCIDEDACIRLQTYIETLERHYLQEEGGKEIMSDIESRIAELFREALNRNHKEVVSMSEIDLIIEIIGTPDLIIDEDTKREATPPKRKLYRDPEHASLGGVAAGLGAYFSISPIWIRIAFLVFTLFYGMTILIYLILWIAIPKAVTTKQKLEMKGEDVNLSNIEKKIRSTYDEVKKNSKFQKTLNQAGHIIGNFFKALGDILGSIVNVISGIFSVIGLFAGSFLILFFCWLILFPAHFNLGDSYIFAQSVLYPIPFCIAKTGLLLFFILPLFLCVFYSAKRLFHFKRHKAVLFISTCLWGFICFCGIFLGIYLFFQGTQEQQASNEVIQEISDTTSQCLTVKFVSGQLPDAPESCYYRTRNRYIWYVVPKYNTDSSGIYFHPQVYIQKSETSSPKIVIEKTARGYTTANALENLEHIQYQYKWSNDTLYLDNYFTLNSPQWRGQNISVRIYLPDGYKINLENPKNMIANRYIYENDERIRHCFSKGQYEMKEGKLALPESK